MHRGRTVLAMDCVLAGAENQHGRPLNSVVRHQSGAPMDDEPRYLFMRTLGAELSVARALEAAGFTIVDEIAYVPFNELLEVQGVPEHRLMELRTRAREHLLREGLGNRPPPWEGMTDV